MAFQFRKIAFFLIFFSYLNACCCVSYITNTTNNIKQYIRNENLDIATKYIKDHNDHLSSIISSVKQTNVNIYKIVSVEYNLSAKNGILLKEKKQNSLIQKIIDLSVY